MPLIINSLRNRSYEVKYDLTTLKLDFAVNQKANIDEPNGKLTPTTHTMIKRLIQFGKMF